MDNQNSFKNILTFCILMENGDGIMDKSPSYIEEKFKKYCIHNKDESYLWGLDSKNAIKFERYIKKWNK